MSEKVNMYAEPTEDGVKVETVHNVVDSETLTDAATSEVDVESYLERHYSADDRASGYIGTVQYTAEGRIEEINIATKVRENPRV